MAEDINALYERLGKLSHQYGLQEEAVSDATARLKMVQSEMQNIDKKIRKLEANDA